MFNPGDKVLWGNAIELVYNGAGALGLSSFTVPSMGNVTIFVREADIEDTGFFVRKTPEEPAELGTVYTKDGHTYVKADNLRMSWWCGKEQCWYSWQEILDRPAPVG